MKDNTGLACLGLLALFVVVVVISAAVNGWVISIMWGWFIVPVFGLPSLSVLQAIGLGLVAGMFTSKSNSKDDGDKSDKWISAIAYAVGTPLITLFIGWIVYGLM